MARRALAADRVPEGVHSPTEHGSTRSEAPSNGRRQGERWPARRSPHGCGMGLPDEQVRPLADLHLERQAGAPKPAARSASSTPSRSTNGAGRAARTSPAGAAGAPSADSVGMSSAGSTLVCSTSRFTTSLAISSCSRRRSSSRWATSTRAACQADQCPETNAHNDNAETYTTLETQPVASDTGIMTIQKMVNHPLIRRMNTGSPCTDAQNDLTTLIATTPSGSAWISVGAPFPPVWRDAL